MRGTSRILLDDGASTRARGELTTMLEGRVPARRLADALLGVSELVSNAVRYSSARYTGSLTMVVDLDERCLRVEVEDPGLGFDRDAIADAPERATSGFGLRLVAEVADRWGVLSRTPSRVWFTIDL